jgi:TrmH family RNA methyltransferase
MSAKVLPITARDNSLLVRIRRLSRGATSYRRTAELWIEGEHLCEAWLRAGRAVPQAVVSDSAWARPAAHDLAQQASRVALVPDALFTGLSGLDSPTGLGFVVPAPPPAGIDPAQATVVLDRVQDAGNVGSILRSAAAMGFQQVLAIEGTAGLWSPKALRAGMGAQFALRLSEALELNDLRILSVPLLATSPYAMSSLGDAALPYPCAWVFGHEGQGVGEPLLSSCQATLRIPQPGGGDSLNVAAAAAICLFESRAGREAQ